jgi:hypothetical protein
VGVTGSLTPASSTDATAGVRHGVERLVHAGVGALFREGLAASVSEYGIGPLLVTKGAGPGCNHPLTP